MRPSGRRMRFPWRVRVTIFGPGFDKRRLRKIERATGRAVAAFRALEADPDYRAEVALWADNVVRRIRSEGSQR